MGGHKSVKGLAHETIREDHQKSLVAKNKWSLIIETEDMGCQAVDTKINKS